MCADDVGQEAPDGTGGEGDELVDEAQGAHEIADAALDPDHVGDDEGDGGVEEDEKGDGEETDAEEIRRLW